MAPTEPVALLTVPQIMLLISAGLGLLAVIIGESKESSRRPSPVKQTELQISNHIDTAFAEADLDVEPERHGRYQLTEDQAHFLVDQTLPRGSRRQQRALLRSLLSDVRPVPEHQMQDRPYDHERDGI